MADQYDRVAKVPISAVMSFATCEWFAEPEFRESTFHVGARHGDGNWSFPLAPSAGFDTTIQVWMLGEQHLSQ